MTILPLYNGSIARALIDVYPDIGLDESKFGIASGMSTPYFSEFAFPVHFFCFSEHLPVFAGALYCTKKRPTAIQKIYPCPWKLGLINGEHAGLSFIICCKKCPTACIFLWYFLPGRSANVFRSGSKPF